MENEFLEQVCLEGKWYAIPKLDAYHLRKGERKLLEYAVELPEKDFPPEFKESIPISDPETLEILTDSYIKILESLENNS